MDIALAPWALLALMQLSAVQSIGLPLDSAHVHREARRAQEDFERSRRQRLPFSYGSGSGRCDVRVGRFCYWHDDDGAQGPEEPASIAPFRERLSARLDTAASLIPGDAWVAGQRVRYLLEARRYEDALLATGECRAQEWWCLALSGLVTHVRGSYEESDSLFASALLAMSEEKRCQWEDMSVLLPGSVRDQYERLGCSERRTWSREIWWLADPLWSVAGNDRRTEHYARQVRSILEEDSRTPYPSRWGKDMHELIVRYGWPERWSREQASTLDPSAIRVIGHEPDPAFDFLPTEKAIEEPWPLARDAFLLRNREALSRYAPGYARAVREFETQIARFFRGDSILVVAAFALPASDSVFVREDARAALVVRRGASDLQYPIVRSAPRGESAVAAVMARADSSVVSVELRDTVHRSLARVRSSVSADRKEIGLLIYREPLPDEGSLEEVLPKAATSLTVSREERIGLYWEVEAAGVSDSVTYVLTVHPRSAGWLTRLARRVGLAEASAPVHLRFTEPQRERAMLSRAVGVDVSHLPPGEYTLQVRALSGEVEIGAAERLLTITR